MKQIYEQLGISKEVYDFGAKIESSLKDRFEEFDKTAEYNQNEGSSCYAEKQGKFRML